LWDFPDSNGISLLFRDKPCYNGHAVIKTCSALLSSNLQNDDRLLHVAGIARLFILSDWKFDGSFLPGFEKSDANKKKNKE